MDFLYRFFDCYCDDTGQEFYPNPWISDIISSAVRELKQGIREKLK